MVNHHNVLEFTICIPVNGGGGVERSGSEAVARFGAGWVAGRRSSHFAVGEFGDVAVFTHGRMRLDGAAVDRDGPNGPARLVEAWRRDRTAFLGRLDGEFLLVMADSRTGAWLAAVDRFSCFRLYYAGHGGQVAIGTSPIEVARTLGLAPDVDARAMLGYAYFHVVPAPLSIIRGVDRLEHGHTLAGDGRGKWALQRYWEPHFEEDRPFDFRVERGKFMDALRTGVSNCVEGMSADEVGCFLSGGTDSSTIAGLASEVLGTGARTFSIGFGVDGFDESHFARLAVERFKTRHTEYYLQPKDVEQLLPLVAASYEQPFGNASAIPTYFCAKLAGAAGVKRMLGGDGGDELYGGNERYARQWLLSLWARVPAPLRSGVAEPLLFGPLKNTQVAPIRKARSYIESSRMPLPDRLQGKYNLLERFGRRNVFSEAFLAQAGDFEPMAMAREVWARCDAGSQINRILAYDFKFTLADSDLPKVTRMCEVAGVQAAYPMLSNAVAEYSLGVPPGQKLRRNELRYFFKRALRGYLPDEILRKEKHGFGMPFGAWMLAQPQLARLADDALAGLAGRGYIRPAFIGELRQAMSSAHAGYYGTMVWILSVLELWFREHLPEARCE